MAIRIILWRVPVVRVRFVQVKSLTGRLILNSPLAGQSPKFSLTSSLQPLSKAHPPGRRNIISIPCLSLLVIFYLRRPVIAKKVSIFSSLPLCPHPFFSFLFVRPPLPNPHWLTSDSRKGRQRLICLFVKHFLLILHYMLYCENFN